MIRSLLTVSCLAAVVVLNGCASSSTPSASGGVQAAAPAAPAVKDDVLAAKLKGNWVGDWSVGGAGGKFELFVTEAAGTAIKGSANWYGTAVGDKKLPITKGAVSGGILSAEQPEGWSFTVSMKDDKTLTGTWSVAGYSGPLNLKRQ
ncbi:MAG: hypothetical protein HYS18_13625 [Burkholderiales bacterium]|nr:hypothetical protein [Burkholderiales bacterium]